MEEICNSSNNGEAESIVRLIDVSLEDDCLISVGDENENDDDDDYFQLPPEDEDEDEETDVGTGTGATTTGMRKSGKCNLRKSLAWDRAFFTSAGVLEPEELSIINSGLTSIQEDIRKSADSSSDDTFTLFDDVRASIHSASASANMDSTSASRFKGKGFQNITNKEAHAQKPKAESAGKNKQSSFRPQAQVAGRSVELNPSSLRPPKIVGRLNSSLKSPTQKSTLGASRVKIDANTRKLSMGRKENFRGSKRPVVGDSNVTPRSTPSPRSSSSSSIFGTKLESAASRSSHNRSSSTSSDSTDRSPHDSLRKKITCRNVSSASNIKPPSRISSINKTEEGNVHPSVHHLPFPKHGSNISPASSLDGWSSDSSSSTSANQHSSSSRKVTDVSSPHEGLYSERGAFQTDTQKHHRNQLCVERKRTGLPSPCSRVSISGTGSLTRPAATDVSRSSKPTGLRMPSPKFGYFDTEKSDEPTPTGFQFHPGVRSALPKHGAGVGNFHGNMVRAKAGKLQPVRSMTVKSSINVDPHSTVPHYASSRRPTGESQELLSASPCVATTKTTGWPLKFSNVSPKGTAPKAVQVIFPSITSIPQDYKLCGGSHVEVGKLGSLGYEGDTGGQNPLLNDMDTTNAQVSATKSTGDCSGISSKLQNDTCPRTCVENYSKAEDVGELSRDCINIYRNERRDGGQDSVVPDTSLIGEKVHITKVTKEDQGMTLEQNDLRKRTGSESPAWNEKMNEVTETEGKELSLTCNNSCQDSFVNEVNILSRKLVHMPIAENTSKNQLSCRSGADVHDIKIASIEVGKALVHDLGHLESNLHPRHDINEKENSFCFDNQTDGLSKHTSAIGSYMEELTGKKDSSFSKIDDTMLSAINFREVLVHDQDFPKVMLKAISCSLSTNGVEILPSTRTPLAVKPYLCNEVATSESASESIMEKVYTSSMTNGGQTDK